MDDGELVKDLRRLNMREGDVLVLSVERSLRRDTAARIRDVIRDVFPDHMAIILEEGARLEALDDRQLLELGLKRVVT